MLMVFISKLYVLCMLGKRNDLSAHSVTKDFVEVPATLGAHRLQKDICTWVLCVWLHVKKLHKSVIC